MPARTYPPRPTPGHIAGRALRRYQVTTIAEVDAALLSVVGWLSEQLKKAPEFGLAYLDAYRDDVDQLLDHRLRLMVATKEPLV
jgi:hypothetical protein